LCFVFFFSFLFFYLQQDITAFLKVVHAAAPDTDALIRIYTQEAARLNARLPLMQRITRREFLKYRIESLTKAAHFDSSAGTGPDEKDKLAQELRSVSDQLRKDLPEYEKTYPFSLFFFFLVGGWYHF
jgi:hypothetical protein